MLKKALMFLIKTLALIFVLLLLVYLFQSSRAFGYKVFSDKPKNKPGSTYVVQSAVHISEGESLLSIGEDLVNKKIVENKWTFAIALRCMEGYEDIIPGDYVLNSGLKPSQILTILTTKEGSE